VSSDSKLKALGEMALNKRSPLCKSLEESSKQAIPMPVTNMNSWLAPLRPQIFSALLKIARLPSFIALPLMEIGRQSEKLEPVANESPWKQAQFVMRHYLKKIEKPAEHLSLSERMQYFGNPEITIWFLEDKRIESKIFETRFWQVHEHDTSLDYLDAEELLRVYDDLIKPRHKNQQYGIHLSPEEEVWHSTWEIGLRCKQPAPGISQAEMLAYCLGCGERRDSRKQGEV
jgi:hypothetical protein